MPCVVRAVAALCLIVPAFAVGAASFAERFTPGTAYYFDNFDPGQQPWKPGQDFNFEEVFKNYQYYEIVLDRNGNEITVNRYIRGDRAGSEEYLVLPDGSLRRK